MKAKPFIVFSALFFFLVSGLASYGQAYGIATPRPVPAPFFDAKLPSTAPVPSSATGWTVAPVFPNLHLSNPMGITQMPGTTLMVVCEREGTVRLFEKTPDVANTTMMLDISNRVQGWDDCGLMSIAFHPQFSLGNPAYRYLYVYYVYTQPGTIRGSATARPPLYTPTANRLSRFTVGADGIVVAGSEFVLIHQLTNVTWHHGGGMFFHPTNGFLYLVIGDDLDEAAAQKINGRLIGGIIRIDVDQRGGGISHPIPRQPVNGTTTGYFIPNDNPFVGVANALEEFYAIGLRSPHRLTHDAVTGRIFMSDTGGDLEEEINTIEPSDPVPLNFQWPKIEGGARDLTGSYLGTSRRPFIHYGRAAGDGSAAIAGYIYRGSEFAGEVFAGKFIHADNVSGRIWWADESTYPATKRLITTLTNGPGINTGDNYAGISSFGLDAANELYIIRLSTTGGGIFKLAKVPPGTVFKTLPKLLSQTALFSSTATLTPSAKLVPYTVNAPFWSDAAAKSRWAAIPSPITFAPTGEWTFPTGSVFVKHFSLPTSDVAPSDPILQRRLETRVLVKTTTGVYGASYKWRADGKDAEIVNDSVFENIPIAIAPTGPLTGSNIGAVSLSGSGSQNGTALACYGAGMGLAGSADQGRMQHIQRSGDFDLAVRVASLGPQLVTKPTPGARLSLLVRESLSADSRCIALTTTPPLSTKQSVPAAFTVQARTATSAAIQDFPVPTNISAAYPNVWLRLARTGDLFVTYLSQDGAEWTETGRVTMALPAQIYWGLFIASGNTTARGKSLAYLQNTRLQRWTYPGPQSCLSCHNAASGGVLGLSTRQMNGNYLYAKAAVTDNQLRAWAHAGLFSNAPLEADIPTLSALVPLSATSASLEDRARSYLDANCSSCHRPGGVPTLWDARHLTPLATQGIINGDLITDLGITGAKVIKPADVTKSMIHLRTDLIGPHQMPPIGRNRIDAAAVKLLEEWIASLPP